MADDQAVVRRRYRRYTVVFYWLLGIALGIGIGSLAALTARWEFILFLPFLFAFRLVARSRSADRRPDPAAWIWQVVALVIAIATFVVVPPDVAPLGLGVAIAIWFGLIVVGGVLEVVLDPDGRLADTPE